MLVHPRCRWFALAAAVSLFTWGDVAPVVRAADEAKDQGADDADADYSDELPRIPHTEPADALATLHVQPGFRVEQVAAEPLLADPVAAAFDEEGRLYVVEMRGYSEQPDEALSQVRLLVDNDHDGHFDKSSLFVDQLSWPTAVACYDKGIFVGDAPDIWYFKDTDGDGVADVRRKVLTGFGKSNVQGLLNSFQWGLDHLIHGATSSSGGDVRLADDPQAATLALGRRDFAFDPRTLALTATSGGAQHGMSFDDWGRKFVCSNSDHIQQVMYEDRYVARNPYLAAPGARISIAADGPQAEVYRLSPVEPWRIVRTRLRVGGKVPGPIEGGGRAAGYFTGATGATIYRGNAWPKEFHGLAVVGDVGSNLVHRKRLTQHGLEFVAERIDEQSEFVASTDIWFRPAQFLNGPDGALYILDVYREVIEHPLSLPDVIKRHLDLTSGRDRGRVYRIIPDGFQQPTFVSLGNSSTPELVAMLAHENGWQRDTAGRLLYERQDTAAIEPLRRMILSSPSALGRMHALYALDGLNGLDVSTTLHALRDDQARVREHAVKLSEHLVADEPEIRAALVAMTADADDGVRYQLAFTLGEFQAAQRNEALVELAKRGASDRWQRMAVQSSLGDGAGEVLVALAQDETFRRQDGGAELLANLARQVGLEGRADEVGAVLKVLESLRSQDENVAQVLVRGLTEGLTEKGSPLRELLSSGQAGDVLQGMLTQAREAASDQDRALSERVEAIRTLGLGSLDNVRDLISDLLDNRQPQEVQLAAFASLSRFDDPGVAPLVLEAWPSLSPRLRVQAAEALLARTDRVLALLDAVEAKTFKLSDLEPARLKLLGSHADANVRERAQKLLASLPPSRRQEVVKAYRSALDLQGDAERGKLSFKKICAACHKVDGVGHEIGPNLATLKNRGAEAILVNVLDPNKEVNPQYVNYVLVTEDGLTLTGILAEESATSVTLKRAENAKDTVLRINIDILQSSGLSLMPEGVEKELDPQAMADLIAYVLSLK